MQVKVCCTLPPPLKSKITPEALKLAVGLMVVVLCPRMNTVLLDKSPAPEFKIRLPKVDDAVLLKEAPLPLLIVRPAILNVPAKVVVAELLSVSVLLSVREVPLKVALPLRVMLPVILVLSVVLMLQPEASVKPLV